MSKVKMLLIASVMLAVMGAVAGCKKNKDNQTDCKIVAINPVPIGNGGYQIAYNGQGKVEHVTLGTAISLYTYEGNTVTVATYDSGHYRNKTVATLNDHGLAVNVRFENDATGTSWSNNANEYDGDQITRTKYTSSASAADSSFTTYIWSGGNMTGAVSGTDTTKFGYYTDKPRQSGDYLWLLELLQGYELYRTKNLFRSSGGAELTYEFAADGKITSLQSMDPNSLAILDYEYQCN